MGRNLSAAGRADTLSASQPTKCRQLMSHTSTHTTAMQAARPSPNASSFFLSGVSPSSSAAAAIWAWIAPISVPMPVAVTIAVAAPETTAVAAKMVLVLSRMAAPGSSTASTSFAAATDSPVRDACSTRSVAVSRANKRASAGTRSPAVSRMTSPTTSSRAGTRARTPPRTTVATSGCMSLRAASAASALDSCQTPTTALRTRMATMTAGSTNARAPSSPPPSARARPKETAAAASRTCGA